MSPRLHVFLGAGGVGKTTLAAAYALALSRRGGRVGLLGIDPSRRLQGALGLALADRATPVPGYPNLRAAVLSPAEAVRRWAAEACAPGEAQRLAANPFFRALNDRVASAADVFAAVRVAEWAEKDPGLADLVVDTAPGVAAVDFLRRPKSLEAFLHGRLVGWLRLAARGEGGGFGLVALGARRALAALGKLAGAQLLGDLAELVLLVRRPLEVMARRLELSQRWLGGGESELVLVATAREDSAAAARQLADALRALNLVPAAVAVNRALPAALSGELAELDLAALPPEAAALVRYARAYAAIGERVQAAVRPLAQRLALVPDTPGLDQPGRLDALAALGDVLCRALAATSAEQSAAAF